MRLTLLSVIGLLLTACVAALDGTVSTATYTEPPQQPLFIVISPNSLSLAEHNITALIEKKMSERGYKKANSRESANVAVLYKYSIGTGQIDVSSSPDFVWGGQKIESTTTYPRFFQIMVVDLKKSKIPEKIDIIWQGEVYSSGSSANISKLVIHFVDVLFENYGTTVTNKSFFKVVEW
jgi:hypothetical protein